MRSEREVEGREWKNGRVFWEESLGLEKRESRAEEARSLLMAEEEGLRVFWEVSLNELKP